VAFNIPQTRYVPAPNTTLVTFAGVAVVKLTAEADGTLEFEGFIATP
jgi:hypothetical protein